jgi:Cft2 family RNA processing exonuclease
MDFVSHAHSDHTAAVKSSKKILASSATKELLGVVKNIAPQEDFEMPEGVKMLDAGHILGSKQVSVNDPVNGLKTVYTGDYQLQKSRVCKQIEIEEADVAIVDSTYFQPEVQFDDRDETETALQQWTESKLNSGIVLFGAYALGKAQELVSILNEKGILPIVTKKISRINTVYRNNGVKLDYASVLDYAGDYHTLLKGNFVGIVENHLLPSMAIALSELYNKKVYTAVATGFAKMMRFNTDVQFALSDHADFRQCVEYIEATGAKKVFTYGQNRLALAAGLSDRGYNAMPFER